LLYANALLEEGRPHEAAALLEKDRAPVRSDIEFAIGRAYESTGDNAERPPRIPQSLFQPSQ
jgi:predicted Zn-dependent protease